MANIELKSLSELEEYVSEGYAVIDCYGDFCAACVMLEPVFESAAGDMPGIKFGRVNLSQSMEVAEKFGIDAMPALLFFRDGVEVHRALGSMDRATLNEQFSVMLYQ